MPTSLCIHGHFYQPPREDPWFGSIPCEASAAPMRHWNERILRESYAPLAYARRLDRQGRISDILNCYEWINFNAGPTLLRWMRREAPETLARMQKGDADSITRWGHGNAMAQIYHHIIMPLADSEDRALEIRWAIDDFRRNFNRDPEGMWLPECAVDTPTLESLAEQGITFVILAPRQAKAVIRDGVTTPVSEAGPDIWQPYIVSLPSGRSVNAVFYHASLSQGIAFEGLLHNGEHFWQRIVEETRILETAGRGPGQPLLTLATDGETYGHHFAFGEMALAHVLAQGYTGRDGIRLTNIAAHIAENPPQDGVLLHEPSSWSCVHGVERWQSDCGCTTGGHPGWHQRWRGPLREALNHTRSGVSAHFARAGADCFTDPKAALMNFGAVLADDTLIPAFAEKWMPPDKALQDKAWKLLAMQEQSLASLASCAWFFDDIGRLEPENGLTFALYSMDLACETGGPDLLPAVLDILARAESNQPEIGNGRDLFKKDILPRRINAAMLCLLAWLRVAAQHGRPGPGSTHDIVWPSVSVTLTTPDDGSGDGQSGPQAGEACIRTGFEPGGSHFGWRVTPMSPVFTSDTGFNSLADSSLGATHLNPGAAERQEGAYLAASLCQNHAGEETARLCELGKHIRYTMLCDFLEKQDLAQRPRQIANAAHALSLMETWHEAQHDLTLPEYWPPILPYLPIAAMRDKDLPAEKAQLLRAILDRQLIGYAKRLAEENVMDLMLDALSSPKLIGRNPIFADDAGLAKAVRTANLLLPDINWWSVQNRLWDLGPASFPALAGELNFRR